ncbi:hypothetical protein ANOM_006492 [Aspergillus nomiae NRRL 13137]|uniref:Uncharacterized protein n=1 Tax=Aspergillus nomiae NRRL (strain ATCC 15546 / NRRL 13137 / CBS 260.88 / M93) TaxID=1509407 RepID=A0A0L1J4K7_ASPN3|nr:uncharacterized protein ANOM_006492 [Aspergillus nomiae NRRL 13137]KNG86605.1 hypothetical protein ANOM_006492 [Aspergillus nomiae NRRL 13137]
MGNICTRKRPTNVDTENVVDIGADIPAVHMTFSQRCIVMIGPSAISFHSPIWRLTLCTPVMLVIYMVVVPMFWKEDAASFRINNASGPNNGG